MRYRVYVTLKPSLLDTQGRAVGEALRALGFSDVEDVRVGKLIELQVANGTQAKVEEMCHKLLANPVIEEFQVESCGNQDSRQ